MKIKKSIKKGALAAMLTCAMMVPMAACKKMKDDPMSSGMESSAQSSEASSDLSSDSASDSASDSGIDSTSTSADFLDSVSTAILRQGASGGEVKEVQRRLKMWG